MSNAGDYYNQKYKEAKEALKELESARARGAGYKEIAALERKLEMARYVGD